MQQTATCIQHVNKQEYESVTDSQVSPYKQNVDIHACMWTQTDETHSWALFLWRMQTDTPEYAYNKQPRWKGSRHQKGLEIAMLAVAEKVTDI